MAEYTNRAPLFKAEGASPSLYAAMLSQLLSNLTEAGLNNRIRWEIGKCVQNTAPARHYLSSFLLSVQPFSSKILMSYCFN